MATPAPSQHANKRARRGIVCLVTLNSLFQLCSWWADKDRESLLSACEHFVQDHDFASEHTVLRALSTRPLSLPLFSDTLRFPKVTFAGKHSTAPPVCIKLLSRYNLMTLFYKSLIEIKTIFNLLSAPRAVNALTDKCRTRCRSQLNLFCRSGQTL